MTLPPYDNWPQPIRAYIGNAVLTDSSGHSGAVTWRIDTTPPCYLKISTAGALQQDAEALRWFAGSVFPLPQVLAYVSAEQDYLLTSAVPGTPAYAAPWQDDPARLAALCGAALRQFHEAFAVSDCPLHNSAADMLARVERNHAACRFDEGMLDYLGGLSGEEAYQQIQQNAALLRDDVVLHGDWCLPNILIEGWHISALLDLGMAGRGDRHYDLHWGCWSLAYNLHTRRWVDTFLDAYGRDAICLDRLYLAGLISAIDE